MEKEIKVIDIEEGQILAIHKEKGSCEGILIYKNKGDLEIRTFNLNKIGKGK